MPAGVWLPSPSWSIIRVIVHQFLCQWVVWFDPYFLKWCSCWWSLLCWANLNVVFGYGFDNAWTPLPGSIEVWSINLGLIDRSSWCIDRMTAWLLWARSVSSVTVFELNPNIGKAYPSASSKEHMLDTENMLERKSLLAITLFASFCMARSSCGFYTILLKVPFFCSIIPTLLCSRKGREFSFTPLFGMAFMIVGHLNSSSPEI